jgi:hypothetical protein
LVTVCAGKSFYINDSNVSIWNLKKGTVLIKLRIDVDYAYPSRVRSFLYTALGIRMGKDYLRNSKIVATMINDSSKQVKAYWFFTPKTVPDDELMHLLDNNRNEIALHIVKDPYGELAFLEGRTGKKMQYYTIHGTSRVLARLMWRRLKTGAPKIPTNFPLQDLHKLPTIEIDRLSYAHEPERAISVANSYINGGYIILVHPIWLFQRGRINRRGASFEVLKGILK